MRDLRFAQFAAVNYQRCQDPKGFDHLLNSWSTSDWMTAMVGEVGEAANIIKKLNRSRDGVRGNKQTDAELHLALKHELGDIFVYLDLMCQSLGYTIEEAAVMVFNEKSKEIGYPFVIPV